MNESPSKKNSKPSHGSKPSAPGEESGVFDDITGDNVFTIKVSEEMTLRNTLRSGLVDAQGKDTDKIPLYVSWPNWLEDGIVCLFAKDFHTVLQKAVKDAVMSLNDILKVEGISEGEEPPSTGPEPVLSESSGPEPFSTLETEQAGMLAYDEGGDSEPDAVSDESPFTEEEKPVKAVPPKPPETPETSRKESRDQQLANDLFKELKNDSDQS